MELWNHSGSPQTREIKSRKLYTMYAIPEEMVHMEEGAFYEDE